MQHIEEPQQGERVLSGAFWQLGFRPFYLVGATFASVSIVLWVLQFTGIGSINYLPGPLWHAHEMLFGFILAIIVGFLFTAGSNWTGQPTPRGVLLAAMVLVWMLARLLSVMPYATAAAIVDVAFPVLAAIGIGKPLLKSRNRRNYFFVVLLLVLAVIDAIFYLAQSGVANLSPRWAIQAGLDVVLVMLTVMGGRVIPMFTNNGVLGAGARRIDWIEKAAIGMTVAVLVVDLSGFNSVWLALLFAACGLAQAARWSLWHPWTTMRTPIVWILHAGYVWIPIHLFLRALAELGWVTSSAATHALAVGAAGGVILGMITRTARGHTGRLMKAGRSETVAYLLVVVAALVRVGLPIISPEAIVVAVAISGACWSAAFAIYAARFWPILTRKRVDGKPG